jgi:hypothetical protein
MNLAHWTMVEYRSRASSADVASVPARRPSRLGRAVPGSVATRCAPAASSIASPTGTRSSRASPHQPGRPEPTDLLSDISDVEAGPVPQSRLRRLVCRVTRWARQGHPPSPATSAPSPPPAPARSSRRTRPRRTRTPTRTPRPNPLTGYQVLRFLIGEHSIAAGHAPFSIRAAGLCADRGNRIGFHSRVSRSRLLTFDRDGRRKRLSGHPTPCTR